MKSEKESTKLRSLVDKIFKHHYSNTSPEEAQREKNNIGVLNEKSASQKKLVQTNVNYLTLKRIRRQIRCSCLMHSSLTWKERICFERSIATIVQLFNRYLSAIIVICMYIHSLQIYIFWIKLPYFTFEFVPDSFTSQQAVQPLNL